MPFSKGLCDCDFSLGGGYGDGTDIRKLAYFESAINPEYAKGKVSKVILFSKRCRTVAGYCHMMLDTVNPGLAMLRCVNV